MNRYRMGSRCPNVTSLHEYIIFRLYDKQQQAAKGVAHATPFTSNN